jgi:hypothetical protein
MRRRRHLGHGVHLHGRTLRLRGYFPDGNNIAYGRQQIDRRGGRIVLPIQSKMRMAAPYRIAFDYHCKLDMPADPISPAARADCIFLEQVLPRNSHDAPS